MPMWKDFIEKRARIPDAYTRQGPVWKQEAQAENANDAWRQQHNPQPPKGEWASFMRQATRGFPVVDEYINRGAGALLGGAAGGMGALWDYAGSLDRSAGWDGWDTVLDWNKAKSALENTGRQASSSDTYAGAVEDVASGAKAGAKAGFGNPDLLGSALQTGVINTVKDVVPNIVSLVSENAGRAIQGAIDNTAFGEFANRKNDEYWDAWANQYPRASNGDIAGSMRWMDSGQNMLQSSLQWPLFGAAGKGVSSMAKGVGLGGKATRVAGATPQAYMVGKPLVKDVAHGAQGYRNRSEQKDDRDYWVQDAQSVVDSTSAEDRQRVLDDQISILGNGSLDDRMDTANRYGMNADQFQNAFNTRYRPMAEYIEANPDWREQLGSGKHGFDDKELSRLGDRLEATIEYFQSGQDPNVAVKHGLSAQEINMLLSMIQSGQAAPAQ